MSDDKAQGDITVPVMIIGGGPVGMTLAMSLHAQDTSCLLVEQDSRPRRYPKGSAQNSRTMEHYRRFGIASQLRALGLPNDYPTDVGYFTRLNSWELTRLPYPSEDEKAEIVALAGPLDQEPEPMMRCNQMYSEDFMFRHLQTLPGVDLRFGWQCLDFTENAEGVTAEIEQVETGERRIVRAAYLAGCDGGQGLVRRKLGVRYGGESVGPQAYMSGRMAASYLRVPEFYKRVPHGRCWQYWIVSGDARGMAMALNGQDEILFGTNLPRPEDQADEPTITAKFRACFGEDLDVEFLGHRPWTAGHGLVADTFRAGRVFLAGDSAHLFTPTGGFGLNTGVEDAVNLGWKLGALASGWGGDALLDSYEIERRPVAVRNTNASKELARNLGAVPVGPNMNEDSPAGAAQRQEAAVFLSTFGEEFASLGVQLGARYEESAIIIREDGPPPADEVAVYTPTARPGGRTPHLWLDDHSSLYDHFGSGFTLLSFVKDQSQTQRLSDAAAHRNMPLKTVEVDHPAGHALYACDFALVRPDHYVAWRGDRIPEDCDALLARVAGFAETERV